MARSKPSATPAFDAGAVALFQQAVEGLQRHAYKAAADNFRLILDRFPTERAVLDRSRVYLDICEREMGRKPASPRTLEERLTAATAALNNGDEAQAERLAKSVLSEDPRHDLALYLLAAVEARRGKGDEALGLLSQAIAASPEVRAQARHDADFESLRSLSAFQSLIEQPAPPPGQRRGRRAR